MAGEEKNDHLLGTAEVLDDALRQGIIALPADARAICTASDFDRVLLFRFGGGLTQLSTKL